MVDKRKGGIVLGLAVAVVAAYLLIKPPECIPHSEKLQAVQDYYNGLITKAELDAILALPTCPE